MGEHIKSPIFKYLLAYRTPIGMLKNFRNLGNGNSLAKYIHKKIAFAQKLFCLPVIAVSSHADDLEYLWYSRFFRNRPRPSSPQEQLVHVFTTMWTNFAKTGLVLNFKDILYCNFHWIHDLTFEFQKSNSKKRRLYKYRLGANGSRK